MANKSFGTKQLDLTGASGSPIITSPSDLSINATTVAISTNISVGGYFASNVNVGTGYSVGIGTTIPIEKLQVSADTNTTIRINNADDSEATLYFHNTGSHDRKIVAESADMIFYGGSGAASEHLRITQGGNLLRGGTGQDIGANGAPWDKIYAGEFIGDIRKTQTELIITNINVLGIATFKDDVEFHGSGTYNDQVAVFFDKSINHLRFKDNVELSFGDEGATTGHGDLRIFHDGSESKIWDNGAGGLVLQTASSPIELRSIAGGFDTVMLKANVGASIDLHYNGTKRLETTNTGVNLSLIHI